jgi:cell wall-associated NlpC family hydrolase
VNRPVDDLRRERSLHSERICQARLGEAVRVLESAQDWAKVRLEHDGYLGWIHASALHPCSAEAVATWKGLCDALVTAGLAEARDEDGVLVQKVAFATRLPVVRREIGCCWVLLPDGRQWRLLAGDLTMLEAAPRADAQGIAAALELLRQFLGVPYLWGGRTPYGYDCSGLAGSFHACLGIAIPRDADQQFALGEPVEGAPQPGDLLFFGAAPDPIPGPHGRSQAGQPRITHVGISLGGDDFIHANEAQWGVSCGSLSPQGPARDRWLRDNYRGARRFRSPL